MLLVPDDRLAEVEPSRFESEGIAAEVGVAAPDIEGPTETHDPRGVREPGQQQRLEGLVADEVVDEGAVLGTELAVGGMGLLGMAFEVELLVGQRSPGLVIASSGGSGTSSGSVRPSFGSAGARAASIAARASELTVTSASSSRNLASSVVAIAASGSRLASTSRSSSSEMST
jgi:hypothetical protein